MVTFCYIKSVRKRGCCMEKEKEQKQGPALTALASVTYEELVEDIAGRVAEKIAEKVDAAKPQSNYLDAKSVMKMLDISPGTLRKKVESGELPEPVIGGGRGAKMIWKREQFA